MGQRAALLFNAMVIVSAIIVAGMLGSGWSGGRLNNDIEWLFWAGAVLGAAGIVATGSAAVLVDENRMLRICRIGMGLFLAGPLLCVIAVFTDYWI